MSIYLDSIIWNEEGLVPVIIQETKTNKVIMFAWMSRESLNQSLKEGKAIYWSRSRKKIWMKGEESGHIQYIDEILLDCDQDALLLKVRQEGGIACHTGRSSCFYRKVDLTEHKLIEIEPVIKEPSKIYKDKNNG